MASPMEFRFPPRRRAFRMSVGITIGALATAVVWGCSSDSSGPSPDPGIPTTLTAVEGMGLQAPAGTILPEGPTVQVLDQYGEPSVGTHVTFQILEGGGTAPIPSRQTDSQGQARVPWILGRGVGSPQRLRATVGSLAAEFQAVTVESTPGESYMGRNGYVQYLPGDLPVVLSAPHGGDLHPAEIPDRTYGTTGQDRQTLDLALRIREEIKELTGSYPYIVLSRLHRLKLDPNREIVEAAQGDPESERAWWEYHTFLEEATDLVEGGFGEGLYIDLHGHGHDIDRLELGYLLSSNDLANSDEVLAGANFINKSSFRALGLKPGADFAELIRGPNSLGSLLETWGVPAVPSQNQPNPGGNPFFSGGYNTARHGSRDGGSVSGVQIECNYPGIRDSPVNRRAFAQDLAEVLAAYFPMLFGMELVPAVPSLR